MVEVDIRGESGRPGACRRTLHDSRRRSHLTWLARRFGRQQLHGQRPQGLKSSRRRVATQVVRQLPFNSLLEGTVRFQVVGVKVYDVAIGHEWCVWPHDEGALHLADGRLGDLNGLQLRSEGSREATFQQVLGEVFEERHLLHGGDYSMDCPVL